MKFRENFSRAKTKEYMQTLKSEGARGLVKKYGWKLVAAVFFYYLIRDSILYILIPYLIAKGIFS